MRFYLVVILAFSFLVLSVNTQRSWLEDQNPNKWNDLAHNSLKSLLNRKTNKNIAKNIILYLGDGMGISTVTAGRIRKGQQEGLNGEEYVTNIEKLHHIALAKTYNIDAQTPDSAGTATAYLSGVKTRAGVIGHDGRTNIFSCESSLNTKLDTILKWAHRSGKSVGIVSTTRVTHASPAATFANVAYRKWETFDGKRFKKEYYSQGCRDIASQLIDNNDFINVVLAGGRKMFLPKDVVDYDQNKSHIGLRIDNRNLINEWSEKMKLNNKRFKFLWNATDFRKTEFKNYEHILGLVSYDHLSYETFRDPRLEPSLAEMVTKAIDLLSQNQNGYFLFVEGGRIDHGHHSNRAVIALDDFVAFDEAIGKGLNLTSDSETMIVATADHSHTFALGGDADRGNPILGIVKNWKTLSDSNLTYTSISYGNGPGGLKKIRTHNLTNTETEKKSYVQESSIYNGKATHAGEDVPVYSTGPMSHLFSNTIEQNVIPHIMAYSACIGPYDKIECRISRGGD